MKFITRHTDYAIQALCSIARYDSRVSVSQLCDELDMPRPFLRGLLQKLNKAGLLVSVKGKGGGFLLGRAADRITLLEIIETFQGPLSLNHCVFKGRPCRRQSHCALRQALSTIETDVVKKLANATLRSLLAERRK